MKNKKSYIVLAVYIIILVIFAFNNKFINDVNISIVGLIFKENKNFDVLINVLWYTELVIMYCGLGIIFTLVCIDSFPSFKYILIYSILLSILGIIIVLLIKSFYLSINFIDVIVMLSSAFLGILIEMIIKIKQVRGEKNEE